jgi:hypothetical protein
MTGTDDNRRRIEELLPFYLNGTLDDAERAEVEAALATDESLRWELEFLKGIESDVQARDPGPSPGEFGLARLMRDIDGETRTAPSTRTRSRIWQIAAAIAVAVVAVQGIYIAGGGDRIVELAGGEQSVTAGPTLTVAFSPDAIEAEIRALLLETGLEIVGGPSALGLWTLAVTGEISPAEAVGALQGRTDIVESAEED